MSNLPKYEVKIGETALIYNFISEGSKGKIIKIISFQETNINNFYNLGLVDENPITGELDDQVVSNNGDTEKVLNTVVSVIYDFTELFPNVRIYAEGSTPSRTRLYQMKIVKYFDIVIRDFHLLCLLNGEWEEFRPKVNYEGFAIKRK